MSQHTSVHTKQEFIKMLQDNMKDDEVVLWTQNATVFEYKKRANLKTVTFGFSGDAFESKTGVGEVLRSSGMGIIFCNRDLLSKEAKDLVPEKSKRKKNEHNKK